MNGSLRIVLGLSSCSFSKKAEDDDISLPLANTKETLYLVNRLSNQTSAPGAWEWIGQAIEVTADFDQLWLRGDTDFSLTGHLNKWDKRVKFVLGCDARQNVAALAQQIQETTWQQQERPAR